LTLTSYTIRLAVASFSPIFTGEGAIVYNGLRYFKTKRSKARVVNLMIILPYLGEGELR
jgi:hypothetical protein